MTDDESREQQKEQHLRAFFPYHQQVRDPSTGNVIVLPPPTYVYDLEAAATTWVHSTRGLLLKEAKRRRLEIILQSTAAITLPMFLVTNFFTMNVPGLPMINFWWVFLLTLMTGLLVLLVLLFVWFGFFFNKRKAVHKVRRLVRRRATKNTPSSRSAPAGSASGEGNDGDHNQRCPQRHYNSNQSHQNDCQAEEEGEQEEEGDRPSFGEEREVPPRPSLEVLIARQ